MIHRIPIRFSRHSKFRAKITEYQGEKYASRKEALYAQELDIRHRAGEFNLWERQFRIPIVVNEQKICTYVVDFLIWHKDGRKELVEVKGFETDVFKLKRKLLEATWLKANPDYFYTIVK